MRLEDVDLTVSQVFSKGFPEPVSVLPQDILRRKKQQDPDSLLSISFDMQGNQKNGIHESRMLNQEQLPMIISGTRAERQEKQFLLDCLDDSHCDRCGKLIRCLPWDFNRNHPRICTNCAAEMGLAMHPRKSPFIEEMNSPNDETFLLRALSEMEEVPSEEMLDRRPL